VPGGFLSEPQARTAALERSETRALVQIQQILQVDVAWP
jgi:hypothetical protein